ncbi:MAG: hypothetical protein ACNS62_18215 [Candidatus Cyclobacteriaceae bacterium M3_2C_046]
MRKIFFIMIMLGLSIAVQAQRYHRYDAGIGLRIGDPFGISYKQYLDQGRALEINFGSTAPGLYSSYFRDAYRDISEFDDFVYEGHSINYALALQGRLLFHNQFPENIDGLEWYWGLGAQMQLVGVEYQYRLPNNRIEYDNRVDIALGPDVILGTEYKIPDVPLAAFIDLNLFMELIDNPFRFRFQGGIGIRYNFYLR